MADYHALITKAVSDLGYSTADARRILYDRARTALLAGLRRVTPRLDEAEISRERQALDDAIRDVEFETVGRARSALERVAQRRQEARPERSEPPAEYRRGTPEPRREAADYRRETADYRRETSDYRRESQDHRRDGAEYRREGAEYRREGAEQRRELSDFRRDAAEFRRETAEAAAIDKITDSDYPKRPPLPRSQRDRGRSPMVSRVSAVEAPGPEWQDQLRKPVSRVLVGALGVVLGISGAWTGYEIFGAIFSGSDSEVAMAATDRSPGAAPRTTSYAVSAVGPAQGLPRAVLYEEDAGAGREFAGSAVWRADLPDAVAGQPQNVAVRADITFPERGFGVHLSMRRNEDDSLSASHGIEISFTLPPDFQHGGIADVPGLLMKEPKTNHDDPLTGMAVKVTPNVFLVSLSAAESDLQRNMSLLKDRSWFDIPILFTDGRRAIIAIEKGQTGARAFSDAFAAWNGRSAAR